MSRVDIGAEPFRVWLHRGAQLATCRALRMERNYLRPLLENMNKMQKQFRLRYFEAGGTVKPHGAE